MNRNILLVTVLILVMVLLVSCLPAEELPSHSSRPVRCIHYSVDGASYIEVYICNFGDVTCAVLDGYSEQAGISCKW